MDFPGAEREMRMLCEEFVPGNVLQKNRIRGWGKQERAGKTPGQV